MDALSARLEEPAEIRTFRSIEQPFIGRWNQLVSTTNWEKGRIIHQWREAFIAAGAAAAEYSDDAWSQLVGGVSGQHVGRLRRVYQKFGTTHEQYPSLFWSHFQAAIDWDDAEMWLEGAVHSDWSVMDMRRTRWETLGGVPADKPTGEDVRASELDEDFVEQGENGIAGRAEFSDDSDTLVPEGPDFGDESDDSHLDGAVSSNSESRESIPLVRPFENLADLPPDFADAFEAFKLSILRHKSEDWQQIPREDVLGALDALKELAMAPNE